MQRIIKSLPKDLDPVKIIERKMVTCPICGALNDGTMPWHCFAYRHERYADANGVVHTFFRKKNKYLWYRYMELHCQKCGCKWDTGWYPADRAMFEIPINSDNKNNYETLLNTFGEIMTKLGYEENLK